MNIKNNLYKTSMLMMLASISVASFATPSTAPCTAWQNDGNGAVNSVIASGATNGVALSDVDYCLAQCSQLPTTGNPATDASNATQCADGLSVFAYGVTYSTTLQGYAPLNTYTPTPSSSSEGATPPATPAPSLPAPVPPQDNNTSQAPGYVPAPQLSNNNANNPNNTNSNNNNISNNTRSYIRWY